MGTMRAVVAREWGGVDVLEERELPIPQPGEGQVRVRVEAAGLNPVDAVVRANGAMLARAGVEPPVVLGWDVSGVVDAEGPGGGRFREGDAVFGLVGFPGVGGTYAEYVVVDHDQLAAKPTTLTHVEAASTPLAGLTVLQGLRKAGIGLEGATVLVHAAAGGVGSLAVQIARGRGAHVAGTASAANQQTLRDLGVATPIDYGSQRFEDLVSDVDLVWDAVGGETQERSWAVMKPGGVMVCISRPPKEGVAESHGMKAFPMLVKANGHDMMELAGLLEAGLIRPVVDRTYALADVAEAHRDMEDRHGRGKAVLTLT